MAHEVDLNGVARRVHLVEPAIGPKRRETRDVGFDARTFYDDLARVASRRGLSLTAAAAEAGVHFSTVSYLKTKGAVPDGINLAALAKWSGLNVANYVVDFTDPCSRRVPP